MVTQEQVIGAFEAFAKGETAVEDFNRWLAPVSWRMLDDAQTSTGQAIYEAELCLAEFTSGHRTEDELRAGVAAAARELRSHAAA